MLLGTAKSMVSDAADRMVEMIDKMLEKLPAEDAIIFTCGFYAGYHGYTPITALMKGAGAGVADLQAKAAKGDLAAGLQLGMGFGGLGMSLGVMYAAFSGPINKLLNSNVDMPESSRADIIAGFEAKIALACVGAVEAYALTRPGTIAGIGQIVQGIGAIIPG